MPSATMHRAIAWIALTFPLGACETGKEPAGPATRTPPPHPSTAVDAGASAPSEPSPSDEAFQRSPRPALQWKRYAAFEDDLAAALALPKDALCKEFGREACIRGVHLSPLGGHDPFSSGLLESSAEPLATTPTVVERIVLSACSERAELDRKAGTGAELFKGLDLAGKAAAPSDEVTQGVVTELYRRFLSRDPEPSERDIVAALAADEQGEAVPALAFAKGACFAVATTTEFLFF
jgi:hypothetical protein